jgi:hypothetical protein
MNPWFVSVRYGNYISQLAITFSNTICFCQSKFTLNPIVRYRMIMALVLDFLRWKSENTGRSWYRC